MISVRIGLSSPVQALAAIVLAAVGQAGSVPAADKPVVMKPMYKVRVEQNALIPMRDGKRLSANLVRPDAAGEYPVVLEYHPYRKDDLSPWASHHIRLTQAQ